MTWPAFGVLPVRPGARSATPWSVRLVASASTTSFVMFAPVCVVSSGEVSSALTFTVSWTVATFMVTSEGTVPPRARVITFSRFAKPASAYVTLYVPGGSALKMYPPFASVTAVRVPRRAGDLMLTVTPGRGCRSDDSTVPLRVPVCVPWANEAPAASTRARTMNRVRRISSCSLNIP